MDTFSPISEEQKYYELVNAIFKLIKREMDRARQTVPDLLGASYPKFVIMYQFFRMLRGESFWDIRPHTPQYQKEFYAMENELRMKLEEIRSQLNPEDELINQYIQDAQKQFNIEK
ncbi:hypothetical protein HY439_02040 [Candidatus Microgenomates bacterium]|nr:hypothetical protein [Candidatus Microgenomates bacterium]